jgi:uncharacterized protein with HEPN domain
MLKDTFETAYLHYQRALDNFNELKVLTIDSSLFSDKEIVKTIDAFLFRFIKLQDFMGDKLFRVVLNSIGEYKDNMSLLDVLDKLEKLQLINNTSDWLTIRQLRNKLTHEYPNNQAEVIAGIAIALQQFLIIESILHELTAYCTKKHLMIKLNKPLPF